MALTEIEKQARAAYRAELDKDYELAMQRVLEIVGKKNSKPKPVFVESLAQALVAAQEKDGGL
jgi:hypothetical protein